MARHSLWFTTSIALFLLMLAMVVASGWTIFSAGQNREFIVTAKQFEYDPSVIRVSLGDNVTIRLRSSDVSHGFYLDGYDYDLKLILKEETIQNGSTPVHWREREVVISFIANKPGTFRFRCSVTCGPYHPFMIGYLVVEPNYQFPISIALAVSVVVATSIYMWKKR